MRFSCVCVFLVSRVFDRHLSYPAPLGDCLTSIFTMSWECFFIEESGDLDEDMFMDVALGRVVDRDLGSGSLLVSRIANYEYVRDPESEGKYAMGAWVVQTHFEVKPGAHRVELKPPS